MNNKPVVLYHAYGLKELYYQVIFSALTLFHHLGDNTDEITCIIYTDDTRLFKKYLQEFPVKYEQLTLESIKAYRGPQDFVHRLKIFIIQDCLTKYQHKILYMDADTYFLKSPLPLIREISPALAIMNSDDYDMQDAGDLEEKSWLMIRKVVKENTFWLDGISFKIPMTTRMWNAGIIGLDFSHLPLLDKVIQLTDQIYKINAIFTAEQFAFSYVLQTNTKLKPTEDYLVHYWPNAWPNPQKILYNYHFNIFFKNNTALPGKELAFKAFELTQKRNELKLPPKTLLNRITLRLKLITEVALKGRITSNY